MRRSYVGDMQERLARFDFDEVDGFSWGRNIIGGGRQPVSALSKRNFRFMELEPTCTSSLPEQVTGL